MNRRVRYVRDLWFQIKSAGCSYSPDPDYPHAFLPQWNSVLYAGTVTDIYDVTGTVALASGSLQGIGGADSSWQLVYVCGWTYSAGTSTWETSNPDIKVYLRGYQEFTDNSCAVLVSWSSIDVYIGGTLVSTGSGGGAVETPAGTFGPQYHPLLGQGVACSAAGTYNMALTPYPGTVSNTGQATMGYGFTDTDGVDHAWPTYLNLRSCPDAGSASAPTLSIDDTGSATVTGYIYFHPTFRAVTGFSRCVLVPDVPAKYNRMGAGYSGLIERLDTGSFYSDVLEAETSDGVTTITDTPIDEYPALSQFLEAVGPDASFIISDLPGHLACPYWVSCGDGFAGEHRFGDS